MEQTSGELAAPWAPQWDRAAPIARRARPGAFWLLAALVAVPLLLRAIVLVLVPLIPEEAYYWMYAQHPSLSYFDHPPMVAWVTRLGTAILGQTEAGVRVVGNLLCCASVVLMYAYARLWTSRRNAFIAAALLLVLPLYLWTGFINTMNSQLMFFWMLCLLGASVALRRGQSWGWYLAGVGFGGALLSKYTGIFVGGGLLLSLMIHRPWRRFLLSPHPYLGAAIGLAMFSPVLIWNARNDWASFRFQFLDRAEAHPVMSVQTFGTVALFIVLQALAVTPAFLWAAGDVLRRSLTRRRTTRRRTTHRRATHRPELVLACCTALPLLASMAMKSLNFEVHLDWTLPAYLSLFPLVCRYWRATWRRVTAAAAPSSARAAKRFAMASLIACIAFNWIAPLFLLVLPAGVLAGTFGPWRPLAAVVETYEDALQKETGHEPLIIARGKYRLASELAFYRTGLENGQGDALPSTTTTSQWVLGDGVSGLGYAYWTAPQQWIGRDCIYVADHDQAAESVRPYFESVTTVNDPRLKKSRGSPTYEIVICRSFRGNGTINQPPNSN